MPLSIRLPLLLRKRIEVLLLIRPPLSLGERIEVRGIRVLAKQASNSKFIPAYYHYRNYTISK